MAAIIIGTLMPIQAGINAELTKLLQNPFLGAFISFFTGAIVLGLILLTQGLQFADVKRLSGASPAHFLGGILGALFVGSSIFFIPKMGATTMMAAYITGQLIMAVAMDHFGWFGVPIVPINISKSLGVGFLFLGLYLVMRKAA